MSISSAIISANSGLAAASKRASIVSNNVANALSPGYARRDVTVSESVMNGYGVGVNVYGVTRASDQVLTAERRLADGFFGRDQATATAYATFNSALGEPGDSFSLFDQYQNLESSLRSLSQSPQSQTLQTQTLEAAKSLTASFNQLSDQAQAMRQNADAEIARQVEQVNATLVEIEKLNSAISTASAGGRDFSALEDQRQLLIDEVASIIPVQEVPRDRNKIDLMTNEGAFLIAGAAREIEFTPTTYITADMTYDSGALSGLSVEGTNLTPGDSGLTINNGSMAGLFEVRDGIAPEFQAQLDGLARDLIERFEGIDATLAAGAPGLFTDAGSAFDTASETGLAGRISVNAAADPDQGGEIWRLRDGLGATTQGPSAGSATIITMLESLTEIRIPPSGTGLSGQMTAIEAAASVTSLVGSSRINAETQLATSASRAISLSDAEVAVTGVDTDVEMQQLLLIEQAFAANARVIQTADEMLRTLMEL